MKPLNKSVLYIFSLVAAGVLFHYLVRPPAIVTFDVFPKAAAELEDSEPPSLPPVALPSGVAVRATPPPSASESEPAEAIDGETGLAPGQGAWTTRQSGDRIEDHKALENSLRFLESMGEIEFEPATEPQYVGRNEDGFDQYEYQTASGEKVTQWKYGSDVSVESIRFEDGTTLLRRPEERNGVKAEVEYQTPDGDFQRVIYDAPGRVEALHSGSGAYEYLNRFDGNGRLIESYRGRRN